MEQVLTCLWRESNSRSIALSMSTPALPDAIAARSSWLMYMPRGGLRLWRPPSGEPRLPPVGPDVGRNNPVRLYMPILHVMVKLMITHFQLRQLVSEKEDHIYVCSIHGSVMGTEMRVGWTAQDQCGPDGRLKQSETISKIRTGGAHSFCAPPNDRRKPWFTRECIHEEVVRVQSRLQKLWYYKTF